MTPTNRTQKSEPAAEWVAIDDLVPWGDNPRSNDAAVDGVAASIKRFGFASPIIARTADRMVIAGHTRLKAARSLGFDRVPVRFVDLDPTDARLLALADNRLGEAADWDDDALRSVLGELDAEGVALDGLGWSDDEIAGLVGDVPALEGDPFASLPTEAPKHEEMTFTLSHEQAQDVRAALQAAKDMGPFVDTGNENSNGNALARVCEAFRG